MIFFSKPSITKTEISNVNKVLKSGVFTDGYFQKKTEALIKKKINSNFIALTQSCTDALELAGSLIDLKPGDEVIMPSYTFTSTANAVVLKGAKPVFVDINSDNLNIDSNKIESLITKKTKAIFIVHYGGSCMDLEKILKIKKKYKLFVIEDTAHSFLAKFNNKFAGTIGDIGVFSFHETKNLVGGQGGAISINNKSLINRANHMLDKGTDRIDFLQNYKKQFISEKNIRFKKKYYSWVDVGSEYRASELSSALIYSQITRSSEINNLRKKIWLKYYNYLSQLNNDNIEILKHDKQSKAVHHLFAFKTNTVKLASKLRSGLQNKKIPATFHYVPLHSSSFGKKFKHGDMSITENIWKKIIRLPIYPDLKNSEINKILISINRLLKKN
jgi:dTDP-4-amino-4,6-dideoxygalactose transaminase